MGELLDLKDKINRYFKFSAGEIRSLIVTILVFAFIISFRDWGIGTSINVKIGLFNFFNAMLIVTMSMLVYQSVQRIISLYMGYKMEYKLWTFGILLGLIVAFITNGHIWFLIPGGVVYYLLPGHRLGWIRYGLNQFGMGMIAAWGPLASIGLAIFFKLISGVVPNPLITKAILFNLAFAVWMILPIPPSDGNKLFFGSRITYAFIMLFVILAAVLLLAPIPIWVSVLGAFVLAFILWLIYYIVWERFNWASPYI